MRNKNEEIFTSKNKINGRWVDYLEKLLNIQSVIDENWVRKEYQTAKIKILVPSLEEISKAITNQKWNKYITGMKMQNRWRNNIHNKEIKTFFAKENIVRYLKARIKVNKLRSPYRKDAYQY